MPVQFKERADRRRILGGVSRVVVKVGSAVIARRGALREAVVGRLAADVADLVSAGLEVIMVVSGAVASGFDALGMVRPPSAVVERQAAASVGQYKLVSMFAGAFALHGLEVAQLLMSTDDIENRRRFLSARHTLQLLLERGIVPIINENDALSDDEAKIGDNDHLAALVTNLASAQLLIVLSNVAGLYRNGNPDCVIDKMNLDCAVDEHISTDVSETGETGVGGMAAKVSAVRLASRWGVPGIIASGRLPATLRRIMQGDRVGTLFIPQNSELDCRRKWIAFRASSRGRVQVRGDTRIAIIRNGAGVAPTAVLGVDGDFSMGARVDILDTSGETFAVGLASYSAHEIRRMKGHSPAEFQRVLGYEYVEDIISPDDLVLLSDDKVAQLKEA